MKNIHILPTTESSRLAFDIDDKFYLLSEDPVFFQHQDEVENRNIYITSDEEIGEGDWYYTERFGIGIAKNEGVSKIERTIDSYKKIIKQETLEEAAEKYAEGKSSSSVFQEAHKKDFIKGAKWQQERSYSEEDLVELLNFVSKEYNISNGIGWFHTHESIEDVSSKEVLDKFFEKRKKK